MAINELKKFLTRAYTALLRSEAHYYHAVQQQRAATAAREIVADPRLITPYGWSGYSQNDEDGILQEVFRRIGTTSRRFVEFGAGECLENTGTYLLLSGWSGTWIDANNNELVDIRQQFKPYIDANALTVRESFITPENINSLVTAEDLDLLVIDIDGNDYYVWKALTVRPRVVMIEYNATFRPPTALVQEYTDQPFWRGENFYGSSLSALESLGREKDYALVGCNSSGSNAFFVRKDLVGGHFSEPFTAEHHYRQQLIDGMGWGSNRQRRSVGGGLRRYKVLDSHRP